MRNHLLASFSALVLAALGGPGCGDDGSSDPVDAATAIDANTDDLNGCTRAGAMDLTAAAATRTIATPNFAYTPPCIRIKAGQSVTWNSEFNLHPLTSGTPGVGPQAGSPITLTTSGNTATFTFPAAGVFGFHCAAHTQMQGVIYVEP